MLEVTLLTVGSVVSIIMFLLFPREPVAAGMAKVNVALFPIVSVIVPPLRESAVVER